MYLSCSKPGVLYELAKIHKTLEDGMPRFLPILSVIKTPTYKLIKFCGQLLKPFTDNKCTIKDFFSFAIEDFGFNDSLFMASFNTRELFTNVPPTETLNFCVLNLYRNQTHAHKLTKS